MAGALLVASIVNFAILMGERYRARINEQSGPAIGRFVDVVAETIAAPPPMRQRPIQLERQRGPGRFFVAEQSPIVLRSLRRDEALERRLQRAFEDAGVTVVPEVRASTSIVMPSERGRPPGRSDGQFFRPGQGDRPFFAGRPLDRRAREIILSAQLPDRRWLSATLLSPLPSAAEIWRLGATTFVTFAFVLGAALWIAGRLSRPLKDLTRAAARVGAASEPEEVAVRGPGDVRQTLEAFNAMSRRVSQLLGEKDVMLGAIGHDLRTPLASLRIRLETMEPEADRIKAIRTIEEATSLLEDILELARQGRSSEPVQTIDLSVLVQDIIEDYAETGAPVVLTSSEKTPVACRPVLFRRALRNLIDNAIAYGAMARVSVRKAGPDVFVSVEDEGPGMSNDALAMATRPFVRGEASRSRVTGGSGLGLTLANAIAKAHGGSLELANRVPTGLAATIRLPLAAAPAPS